MRTTMHFNLLNTMQTPPLVAQMNTNEPKDEGTLATDEHGLIQNLFNLLWVNNLLPAFHP